MNKQTNQKRRKRARVKSGIKGFNNKNNEMFLVSIHEIFGLGLTRS